jgi:dihydroxyacetone kinase
VAAPGDLTVFKIAGAAAEEGSSLDEVERVARLANDRTRCFGVVFSGCTMPGASEPVFTVPRDAWRLGWASTANRTSTIP